LLLLHFFGHGGIILSLYIQYTRLDVYSQAFALSFIFSIPVFMLGRAVVRKAFLRTRWWGIPVIVSSAGITGNGSRSTP